jgi:hypothetical protein
LKETWLVVGEFPYKLLNRDVVVPVDAKSALSANHTASRKAGFTRAESK